MTRGDLVQTISATGTVEAVTTVNVGSQVSGTVQTLNADFNDVVRKGQTLAQLEPSLFLTQVQQADANLVRSEAEVERLAVARDAARLALGRTAKLAEKRLVSEAELESAQVALIAADALLLPNAALRLRPSAAALSSLGGQTSAGNAKAGGEPLTCGTSPACAILWRVNGSTLGKVAVDTGITDGTQTEILGATLAEGDKVATAISVPASVANASGAATISKSSTRSPLLGASPPAPPGGMAGPR